MEVIMKKKIHLMSDNCDDDHDDIRLHIVNCDDDHVEAK